MSGNDDPVLVVVFGLVTETEDAKLFKLDDEAIFGERLWVPKSLILSEDDDSIEVPEWWAIEKGLA